jgi:uncharacterized protein YjiK
MKNSIRFIIGFLITCWAFTANAQSLIVDFDSVPQQVNLFPGLMEVSGLALGPNNTVYTHNDEHGIVYQLGAKDGDVERAFALGEPTLEKDFEGIEVFNDRVYLLSSRGKIYEALIGEHKSRVKYNAYDTGVGDYCETEGLARGPNAQNGSPTFLILCKKPTSKENQKQVLIYRWNLDERLAVKAPWMKISRDMMTDGSPKKFNPSAIEWSEKHQQIFLLSAKSDRFASLKIDGSLVQKKKLSDGHHQQAEGITLLPSGEIMIADEGKSNRPPRLSTYKISETES